MIVKQSVIEFEKLGLGLYLHLGLYSLLEQGEWTLFSNQIDTACYEALAKEFAPQIGWARKIAAFAKGIGCKYMTITTRHHDGFSLYDTRGLNTYDAPLLQAGSHPGVCGCLPGIRPAALLLPHFA